MDKPYTPPTEHVSRMLVERTQLVERVNKLHAFIVDNPVFHTLDVPDRDDMKAQLGLMEAYQHVLERRIRRADPEGAST